MDSKEIQAILKLIDDSDPVVFDDIRNVIIENSNQFLPYLENSWIENDSPYYQARIQELLDEIHIKESGNAIAQWGMSDKKDFLDLWLIIEQAIYNHDSANNLRKKVEKLVSDIWLELNVNMTSVEKVKIINEHFFNKLKIKVVEKNSLTSLSIDAIFNKEEANQLTVSLMYMLVAQRSGLDLSLLNLPKINLLAYIDELTASIAFAIEQHYNIVFYLNTAQKGQILGRKVVDTYLESLSIKSDASFFVAKNEVQCAQKLLDSFSNAVVEKNKDSSLIDLIIELDFRLKQISKLGFS